MKKKFAKELISPNTRKLYNLKTCYQPKMNKSKIKQPQGLYDSTTSFKENNFVYNNRNINKELKTKRFESEPTLKIKLIKRELSQRIDLYKLVPREYAKVINQLFSFLKKVLSNEVYLNIKKKFRSDVYRLVDQRNISFFPKNESKSSIFNYVKYNNNYYYYNNNSNTNTNTYRSKNDSNFNKENNDQMLKASWEFTNVFSKDKDKENRLKIDDKMGLIKFKDEEKKLLLIGTNDDDDGKKTEPCLNLLNDDTKSHLVTLRENTINDMIHNDTNFNYTDRELKQSLNYLTKTSRVKSPIIIKNIKIAYNSQYNSNTNRGNISKTQSNSKSSSRENLHHYIITNSNNSNTVNSYNRRNSRLKNIKSTRGAITPIENANLKPQRQISNNNNNKAKVLISKKANDNKSHILLNGKLFSKLKYDSFSKHNANKKPTEVNDNKKDISIEAIDLFANPKTQRWFKSSVLSNKRKPNFNSKKLNKSTGAFTIDANTTKAKQIRTRYIDLTQSDENLINPMNDAMIKQIKMSLDGNLKSLLDFSYEHFLGKESESQSKQSQDLNEVSI